MLLWSSTHRIPLSRPHWSHQPLQCLLSPQFHPADAHRSHVAAFLSITKFKPTDVSRSWPPEDMQAPTSPQLVAWQAR